MSHTFGPSNAIEWERYVAECERTNTKQHDAIRHGAIGMLTEAGEILDIFKKKMFYDKPVDVVHLKEEIGDFFWYLAIWYSAKDKDRSAQYVFGGRWTGSTIDLNKPMCDDKNDEEAVFRLVANASAVASCDLLGQDPDYGSADMPVMKAVDRLIAIMHFYGLDPADVLSANIAKLRARYPEAGWSQERALTRDIEKERCILEANKIDDDLEQYNFLDDLEVEEAVSKLLDMRKTKGRKKYGKTMERSDLSPVRWAWHAIEELLDAAVYMMKLIREMKKGKS